MLKDLKKKSSNKGFSLVELIIVIAIMAVLVGILAPQYLRYVEKSREAADLANIEQMIKVVQVIAADDSYTIKDGFVIISKDGVNPVLKPGDSVTDRTKISTALMEYMPDYTSIKLKSKKYIEGGSILIELKIVNGQPTVVVTPPIPLP